jgi:hypothetical protein
MPHRERHWSWRQPWLYFPSSVHPSRRCAHAQEMMLEVVTAAGGIQAGICVQQQAALVWAAHVQQCGLWQDSTAKHVYLIVWRVSTD